MTVIDYTLMGQNVIRIDEDIESVLQRFRDQGYDVEWNNSIKCYQIGNSCLLVYEAE